MNGKPIQIYSSVEGKRNLDLQAVEKILKPIENLPVSVISINGICGEGKSFFLNYGLNYFWAIEKKEEKNWFKHSIDLSKGFASNGGIERTTVGIWTWSSPFIIQHPTTGQKIAVLLLDTQGLFDSATSYRENAFVFSLSAWLSSVFIYNIQGNPSADKLDHLLQFCNYSQNLSLVADGNGQAEDKPFQRLLLLLRDWQYAREDFQYGLHALQGSPQENLKNFAYDFLKLNENADNEVLTTRNEIASKFQANLSAFLLPHPGIPISKGELPTEENMDKDFAIHLKGCIEHVCTNLAVEPKVLSGEVQNGEKLFEFLKGWNAFLSTNEMPNPVNLREAVATIKVREILVEAGKQYGKKIATISTGGVSDASFKASDAKIRGEILPATLQNICKAFTSNQEQKNKFSKELEDLLDTEFMKYSQMNTSKREELELAEKFRLMKIQQQEQERKVRAAQAEAARLAELHRQQVLREEEERRRREAEQLKLTYEVWVLSDSTLNEPTRRSLLEAVRNGSVARLEKDGSGRITRMDGTPNATINIYGGSHVNFEINIHGGNLNIGV